MTTVLLVEDNLPLLDSIAFELEARGFTVLKALNGQTALEILETNLPDIIVSDIAMPLMNGYQLLEAAQQRAEWQDTPFIFLTAYNSIEDVRRGKLYGVDDYITKPFHITDLVIAIENKLRRKTQWQASTQYKVEQVRREMMAIMAHEISTQETVNIEYKTLLKELETLPDEFSQKAIDLLEQGVGYTKRLGENIQLLVKVDNGQLKQEIEANAQVCGVISVVETALRIIEGEFEQCSIELIEEQPDLTIWGVHELLVIVMAEIVRNALEFLSNNQLVSVVVSATNQHVIVKVIDEGQGIPPHDLAYVFERFYPPNRMPHGAGLGLAVVRNIVRLHEGLVDIKSQEGRGTQVSLYFPLYT